MKLLRVLGALVIVLVGALTAIHLGADAPSAGAATPAATTTTTGTTTTTPTNAQSLLGVNVARGFIDIAMISPRDSDVTFFEDVAGVRQELGTARSVPPATGGPDGLASIPALPWRCDRSIRDFVGVAKTPDGRTIEAANEARTPDCRDRVSVVAPTRVELGKSVPVTLKDRWQTGDFRVRLCVSRTGAGRKCSRVTFKPGEKKLTVTRAGSRKVSLMDLDLVIAGRHIHRKVGIGRNAPPVARPVALVTGDSMMEGIDSILLEKLKSKYRVIGQTRPGTGVSKPLGESWTKVAATQASKYKPVVTAVLLGGNDGFKMTTPDNVEVDCCGDSWRAEYLRRIEEMATSYERHGAGTVIWSLLPPPKRQDLVEQMAAVNDAIRRLAAAMPSVVLVPLDKLFGPEYRDVIDGKQVRDPDGLHFSLAGQRIAAQAIAEAIRKTADAVPTAS